MPAWQHRYFSAVLVEIHFSKVPFLHCVSVELYDEGAASDVGQGSHVCKGEFPGRAVPGLHGLRRGEAFQHGDVLAAATLMDCGAAGLQRQFDYVEVIVVQHYGKLRDEVFGQAGVGFHPAVSFKSYYICILSHGQAYLQPGTGFSRDCDCREIVVEETFSEAGFYVLSACKHLHWQRGFVSDYSVGDQMSGEVVVNAVRMPCRAAKGQVAVAAVCGHHHRTVIFVWIARIDSDASCAAVGQGLCASCRNGSGEHQGCRCVE